VFSPIGEMPLCWGEASKYLGMCPQYSISFWIRRGKGDILVAQSEEIDKPREENTVGQVYKAGSRNYFILFLYI
jgi:hypothetical protein